MGEWGKGHWCDVCHQKHYQINPACLEERIRRWRAEGVVPMPEIRDLKPIPWERAKTMPFPYNVPCGADEEEGDFTNADIERVIANAEASGGVVWPEQNEEE